MSTTIDRFRLAEAYLDGGDPLQALDMLEPLNQELDGNVAGQLLLARAYYHSAQLGRAQAILDSTGRGRTVRPLRPLPPGTHPRAAQSARSRADAVPTRRRHGRRARVQRSSRARSDPAAVGG